MSKNERIIGLDWIRAIAILGVVIEHSSGFLWPLASYPHMGWLGDVLVFVHHFGKLGVELFFVLSGFLIGTILIKTFVNTDTFSFAEIKNFWIRRWYRTLPNYWLVLTVTIVAYKVMGQGGHTELKLLYYPFLQNLWWPVLQPFFGESWSLSIEEWFYLTLPVAMYVFSRVKYPEHKQRFLLWVFAGYLIIFLLLRFFNAFHPMNGPDADAGIRKVVVFRLDAVMYGVLFAYLNYFHAAIMNRIKVYLLVIGIAGVAILYHYINEPTVALFSPANPSVQFTSYAFLYVLLPLSFAFWLPYANSVKSIGSKFISGVVVHVSKISYSLYLINYSLVYLLFFSTLHPQSPIVVILLYLLYWVIIIGLSSVMYKYFEYPMMQKRDKVSHT